MSESTELPRYRLLAKSPMDRGDGYLHLFEAGTVFESTATPGMHWEPLNEPAAEALDAWLDEKVEILDKDFVPTGKQTTRRAIAGMPNAPVKLSGIVVQPVDRPMVNIMATPDPRQSQGTEFAAARFAQATPFSRPAPESTPQVELDGEGAPKLLHVAPPSSRKPSVSRA